MSQAGSGWPKGKRAEPGPFGRLLSRTATIPQVEPTHVTPTAAYARDPGLAPLGQIRVGRHVKGHMNGDV